MMSVEFREEERLDEHPPTIAVRMKFTRFWHLTRHKHVCFRIIHGEQHIIIIALIYDFQNDTNLPKHCTFSNWLRHNEIKIHYNYNLIPKQNQVHTTNSTTINLLHLYYSVYA